MAKTKWSPMYKHPKGGKEVLVHSCYGSWIIGWWDTEEHEWLDNSGHIQNDKLHKYMWVELPAPPASKDW